ncbi:hypothetical protein FGADI_2318 [Fusarium gaditjirri]|uniref:Uncharacterized protein n=1 Tax=Fusarium gaditjirri TaxID=282569 RepID=A0A8H4X1B9_9HYPO|nr:hypothetical protein FGADI_2318 [Fusarium gaditjirri]
MSESEPETRRRLAQNESDHPKKRQTRAPKEAPSDAAVTAANDCLEQRRKYAAWRLNDHLRPDPAVQFATLHPEVEAEAMALFDASQSKVDLEKFRPVEGTNNPTVNDFRSLWKVCLRVFGWSPVCMISPVQGLKYRSVARGVQPSDSSHAPENFESPDDPDQPDPNQDPEESQPSKGTQPSEVIFPPKFSKLLTTLIVHPCWEWDVNLFILALQYTVKCRVDNRDPWPHDEHLDRVPILRTLRSMFDNPDREPASISEMVESLHNSLDRNARSPFFRFLHILGGQVTSTPSDLRQPQTYLGVSALPVTIRDLRFLAAAVGEFDWGIESWNCSPDDVWKAYRAERGVGRDEVPKTNADTKRYTLRSLKDIYRAIAHHRLASRNGESRLEVPSSAVGENLTQEIDVVPGNDAVDSHLPHTDPSSDGESRGEEDTGMMDFANHEAPLEAGFPTPLSSALQLSLETQINERLSDFLNQQRQNTARLESKIDVLQGQVDVLQGKVDGQEMQLSQADADKRAMSEKLRSHELKIERLSLELANQVGAHRPSRKVLLRQLEEKHKEIDSGMERIRRLEAELESLKEIRPVVGMSGRQGTRVDAEDITR